MERQQLNERARDETADNRGFITQQCQGVARAALVEVAHRQELQVVVEAGAQAGQHPFPDGADDVLAGKADQAPERHQAKPSQQDGAQRRRAFPGAVEQGFGQETGNPGVGQRHGAATQQQEQDQQQGSPLGCDQLQEGRVFHGPGTVAVLMSIVV